MPQTTLHYHNHQEPAKMFRKIQRHIVSYLFSCFVIK
jgi:hypothetical protein